MKDEIKYLVEKEFSRFTKDLIIIDEASANNKWKYFFQYDKLLFEYHYTHKILYCNVSDVILYLKDVFSIDYFETEILLKELFAKHFSLEIELFAVFSDVFSQEKVLEYLKK
jgi:hypothetical protein